MRTDANKDDWDAAFTAAAKDTFVAEGGFQSFSEEKFTSTYENTYKENYSAAFDTATQAANTAVTQTDNQGTITGNFTTTETGSAAAAMEALAESLEDGATAAAKAELGNTYATRTATGTAADLASMSEAEWDAAYETKYQQAFASAYSNASGSIERKSVSDVNVTGLGVIADVNAADSSKFIAKSELIDGAARDGNGNGNASSGANLATSSYANQSNSSTASAFMQAFSGGLPNVEGTTTIDKVTPIVGTVDGEEVTTGYTITTSTIQTTQNTPVAYDVDDDGNLTAQ